MESILADLFIFSRLHTFIFVPAQFSIAAFSLIIFMFSLSFEIYYFSLSLAFFNLYFHAFPMTLVLYLVQILGYIVCVKRMGISHN